MFKKLIYSQIQMSALETASQKHVPIVYVTHSEANMFDKLIVQLTLFLNNFQLPYLFTDKNNSTPLLLFTSYLAKFFDTNKLVTFETKKLDKLDGTSSNDELIFYKHTLLAVNINHSFI
jgi:hypothetical protein